MRRISLKNISLLSLVLTAASAVAAAVVPNKSDGKRVNDGSLRNYSFTDPGPDRDAKFEVVSCKAVFLAQSCTATAGTNTTTGFYSAESRLLQGIYYYQTIGNTSQTNDSPIEDTSRSQMIG